jgi:hypothetical protein
MTTIFLVLVCLLAVGGVMHAIREIQETGWRKMTLKSKLILPLYPIFMVLGVLVGAGLGVLAGAIACIVGAIFVPLYFLILRPLYTAIKALAGFFRK